MEYYQKGTLLSILKILKKKAGGFPSHAQGKEIDSGIVALTFDFYPYQGMGLVFYKFIKRKLHW